MIVYAYRIFFWSLSNAGLPFPLHHSAMIGR